MTWSSSMQCVVYSLNDTRYNGLDSAILEAIIHEHHMRGSTSKVLKQAMIWDRVDIARSALQDVSTFDDKEILVCFLRFI